MDSPQQERISALEAQVAALQAALAAVASNEASLASDHAAHDEVMVGLLSAVGSLQAAHVRIEGNGTEEQQHVDALLHYLEELQASASHPHADPVDLALAQDVGLGAKESVVKVVAHLQGGTRMSGTGWAFDDDSVVTAAHVVSQPGVLGLTAMTADGRSLEARLRRYSGADDLALLDVPGLELAPLPVGHAPAVGGLLVAVGHPQGYAAWSISMGHATLLNTAGAAPRFRSDVPIGQGSSGGPVLDGDGNVAGMTIGGFWPSPDSAAGESEGHVHTVPYSTGAEQAEHVPIETVVALVDSWTGGED